MPTIADILNARRQRSVFDRVSSGSSSTAPEPPGIFERLSQATQEPLPMEGRLSILPAMVTPERGREWALPGVVAGAWNALTAPGRALQGQEVGPDEALNVAGSMMLGGGVVPKPGAGGVGLNVFHGSPHKFDKFDMSKIGTGEGAQAYGHGLYLAEQPSTAAAYKQAGVMTNWADHIDKIGNTVFDQLGPINGKVPFGRNQKLYSREEFKALNAENPTEVWAGLSPSMRTKVENILTPKGNLYKVDLPDEQIAKMLDWDKPLSQAQADAALKAFGDVRPVRQSNGYYGVTRVGPDGSGTMIQGINRGSAEEAMAEFRNIFAGRKGEDAHRLLAGILGGPEQASAALRQAGIPGIRYLDQGSRGVTGTGKWNIKYPDGTSKVYDLKPNDDVLKMMGATAEPVGTSNFVVFDDQIPKILSRE